MGRSGSRSTSSIVRQLVADGATLEPAPTPEPGEQEAEAFARAAFIRILAATRSRSPAVAVIWRLENAWARALRGLVEDERVRIVELTDRPDVAVSTLLPVLGPLDCDPALELEAVLVRVFGGPHLRPRAHLLVGGRLDRFVGRPADRATTVRERWVPHTVLCEDLTRAASWYTSGLRPDGGSPRLVFVAPSVSRVER